MPGFGDHTFNSDGDSAEERLSQEAEELMRQGRYQDAAARYHELRRMSPTDLWASLGYVSALECAGRLSEAENILEEAAQEHRRNMHVQRFRRMFFERREDPVRAGHAREALFAGRPNVIDGDPLDQLADLYFHHGRYHEAQAEFFRLLQEEAVEQDPLLHASIQARLGACLRQEDRVEESRRFLQAALEQDPDNAWTLAELAECERSSNNLDEARNLYLRTLDINPDDHWCRGRLAQLEHEAGNSKESVNLYEQILSEQPQATWALVELAQVLSEGDPERSRNLTLHALQEDPSYPWAYAHLGHLARQAGRLEEARHRFQQALSASPGSIWILHELADTCRHLGRMEEALTHLEHARNSDSFDPTTYGFLGDALRGCGRLIESRAHFAKAVELDPGYTWAWRELAEVQAMLGAHEEALQAYEEARSQEPDDPINDGLMAFLLRCRGEGHAALPFLRRAVERMPTYAWAQRELVESLLMQQQLQEAEACARKGIEHLPTYGPLHLLLAECLRRQGHNKEALQHIKDALSREPEVPQLWAMRAELSYNQDPAQALRYARRAARLDPGPDFQILLAQVLIANHRFDEARQLARDVTRAHPQAIVGWMILSELAEQRGDQRAALVAARLGLQHNPEDWRLALRAASLEWRQERRPGLARLDTVFVYENPVLVPWREVALLFAQAGRRTDTRRALGELLRHSGEQKNLQAEAWRTWSECAIALGDHAEARDAIDQALVVKPMDIPSRLFAAALHEPEEKGQRSIDLLLPLLDAEVACSSHERHMVCYQLIGIYQRHQRAEEASPLWEHLLAHSTDLALIAEGIRHRASQGHAAESLEQALQHLQEASAPLLESEGGQALLRETALICHGLQGAAPAAALLQTYEPQLQPLCRELLAQLQFASGMAEDALQQIQGIDSPDKASQVRLALLEVRCRMTLGQEDTARERALSLCKQYPRNEELALLAAELLIWKQSYAQALDLLRSPQLPSSASLERALFAALLLLEQEGLESMLLWCGCHRETLCNAETPVPLLGVLRRAWPQAFGRAADPDPEHLRTFPPLQRAGALCAEALASQAAPALGLHLLCLLAQSSSAQAARRLWRQAALLALRQGGHRRLAWKAAWKARSTLALLRCCLW